MMKKILLLGGAALLAACSSNYKPPYLYNEIQVVNNSREILREVTIRVPSTGRTFSCGNVAPLGICSNKFGKRRYEYNPIQIDWIYGNTPGQTEEFVIDVPAYFATGVVLRGVVSFSPEGEVSAYFDQESPFR